MPSAHKGHVEHEAPACDGQPAVEPTAPQRQAREPHEHEVAQPERQRDVPPVPEVLDVHGRERRAEVARRPDAETVAGAHGHEAVAREVEEQVQPVHVRRSHLHAQLGEERPRSPSCRRIEAVQPDGYDEGVHEPDQKQQDAPRQKARVLVARTDLARIFGESARAVDGARGEHREEQQEVQVVEQAQLLDDAVAHLEQHLQRLERDVGHAHEAQ